MDSTTKPKIMLHIIMPGAVSGPNTQNKLIATSDLKKVYDFLFLEQKILAGGFLNVRLILDLCKQIRRVKPDLIHMSGLQSSCFHAVLAARICGVKNVLIAIRGSSRDAIGISKLKKLMFIAIFEPLTLYLSTGYYTVCEHMGRRKDVILFSKKYLGTLYNSAPRIFNLRKSGLSIREELKLSHTDVLVIIAGRMTYDKGLTFISEAILNCELSDVKFIFVGDGPMLNYILKYNNDEILNGRVFCLGKRIDVLDIMAHSDIFLFATLHENLSNALLEACVSGLAVICTDVGGNVEVIQDGINGLLISSACTVAINNALSDLVLNNEKRKKLGLNASISVNEKFSQEKLLAQLSSVYAAMLQPC